ncbi:hypothetical protein HZS_4715 [Henneguya salminicola]|nr:hypothetical protein HZS_4715 [Henneguya salminicola]
MLSGCSEEFVRKQRITSLFQEKGTMKHFVLKLISNILPNTTIIFDCWMPYDVLNSLNLTHLVDNYFLNFADLETKLRSNMDEFFLFLSIFDLVSLMPLCCKVCLEKFIIGTYILFLGVYINIILKE